MQLKRIVFLFLLFVSSSMALNVNAADQKLVVSAAASLKETLMQVGKEFEQSHPGEKILFNFSGSSQLASQIEQGAPVDVFASADMLNLNRLTKKKLTAQTAVLAQNKLVLIVSKKSKTNVEGLADLSKNGLRLVTAVKNVPITVYTHQFLENVDKAGLYGASYSTQVLGNVVSQEPDARMVTMKVAMGDGDAGVVYASDITSDVKDKVKVIAIPQQFNVTAEYGVAIIKNASDLKRAKVFYDFLLSPKGTAIFMKNGLTPPQTIRSGVAS